MRLTWQPFEGNFADLKVKFLANAEIVIREAQVHGLMGAEAERQRVRMREEREDRNNKGAIHPEHMSQTLETLLLMFRVL